MRSTGRELKTSHGIKNILLNNRSQAQNHQNNLHIAINRETMVDLEPVKMIMFRYIDYIILLGIALILGTLFFKKHEKWIKRKKL